MKSMQSGTKPRKVIVTTTINSVTEAVEKFDAMSDWHLVVVGDQKTPADYSLENGTYVTPKMQEEYDKSLSDAIGWNCIQRRNFGLLWAHDLGADIVAIIDDDNIPYDYWGKELLVGSEVETNFYETDLPAFDPIGATNESNLWHRGFPLQLLAKRDYSQRTKRVVKADVQADFWNGDPDIDAICRMEHSPICNFGDEFFPIASNVCAPFNSQNTFITGRMLKDYFLFPHVGRMDDIWASFYVQSLGYKVVYGRASVFQERNEHDLTKDMMKEVLGYERNLELLNALNDDPDRIRAFLPERSVEAFDFYQRHFS